MYMHQAVIYARFFLLTHLLQLDHLRNFTILLNAIKGPVSERDHASGRGFS